MSDWFDLSSPLSSSIESSDYDPLTAGYVIGPIQSATYAPSEPPPPMPEGGWPMRLSYSTMDLVHTCPRKYQLQKLVMNDMAGESNESNVHLDFGTAMGAGAQQLIQTRNVESALWVAFCHYNWVENQQKGKTFESLANSIMCLHDKWEAEGFYDKYSVVYNEMGYKITLESADDANPPRGDYFCGYLDLVVKENLTGIHYCIEFKTTGSNLLDLSPMYGNSAQGLGYGILMDKLQSSYGDTHVIYVVFQLSRHSTVPTIHIMPFVKTLKDKLEWLLDLSMEYAQLKQYEELDYYPKRGNSCLKFNTPCYYYGVCGLDSYQAAERRPPNPEDDWDMVISLPDLIQTYLGVQANEAI